MFEPKINKSAPPRPKKNSLFYASCRMQDPDLGDFFNSLKYKRRTSTNVGLVQTLDWYKRRTSTNVRLVQTSDWYKRQTGTNVEQYKCRISTKFK